MLITTVLESNDKKQSLAVVSNKAVELLA